MARSSGIVSSAKHIPGGARPTPAPQAPGMGQISPLAAQLESGGAAGQGYGYAYGGFLPRPSSAFTAGAFGPFSPILPVPIDEPPSPQTPRAEPRRWEYPVGWNLPVGQPGSEGIKLADFGTLKTLADLYSVARAAIQLRKNEIVGLSWDITPTRDAAKAMRGSHSAMKDFGQRRGEAIKFFRRPDPANYFSWGSWLSAVLEEVFVFDALSLLLRPKWAKGQGKGLLGSDLDSLCLIDGPTIRPLVELDGGRPRPPAPAFQQYEYGVPRVDLMTMITRRDVEDGGLSGYERGLYRGDQLLYLPMVARPFTPYGFPPIERALIPVMAGLQKQGYQLDFFREGTVPAVYVSPGGVNANMTPNQLRELQDALNAVAGDPAWKHKIIVLPADSKVQPQKPTEIADQFDEIVMNQVCMAFDVMPMELGIMPRVSTTVSPGAGNQMAKATAGIHERKATKPTLQFLADIFNTILWEVCGQDDMQFVFEGLEEDEDEQTQTQLLAQQINVGLRSIDEGREALGLQPWGLPETSDPGWSTATGFVPLGQVTPSGAVAEGPQPTAANPAGQQAQQPKPGQQQGTPGHAASAGSQSKPASGGSKPAASTPGHAAAQGAASGTKPAASKSAERGPHPHQARRDQHVQSAQDTVEAQLARIADAYRTGHLTAPDAVDTAVAAMAGGYRHAMRGAAGHAHDDHGPVTKVADLGLLDTDTDEQNGDDGYGGGWDDTGVDADAQARAETQRPYLARLIKDLAAGAVTSLGTRLALYGSTLVGAYNAAYGRVMRRNRPGYEIVWRLGNAEHCIECRDRDGKIFTQDTLPGWPGDGGFGGALCLGGPRCACWLQYRQGGRTLAEGGNTQRDEAGPYYQQQLATITARRQQAAQARADFVDSLPDGARARARNRDDIRTELADLANERIRRTGGYPGVSVEPGDIDAGTVAAHPAHIKAVHAELDALARHVRKGRDLSTWEPRHISPQFLARVAARMAGGMPVDDAIDTAKAAARRVDLDGQVIWQEQPASGLAPAYDMAGGGGRVFPAHDVDGTEVPGGVPGPTAGGEPPRWAPREGVGAGDTMSAPRPRTYVAPGDADDAAWPGPRGVPAHTDTWPQGGHGTGQAGTSSPPGVAKGASDLSDPSPVDPIHVENLMRENFPLKALGWVRAARWIGPVRVPLDRIDWDDEDSWAASHQKKRVREFARRIKAGDGPHPAIGVQAPGSDQRVKLVDGHHRALAYKRLGMPVVAYVGMVPAGDDRWQETHSYQEHQGSDPANKAAGLPVAAGVAVRAADTGRVLMLQRAMDPADPAAGAWEFPGGCLEPGESPVMAAVREWQEETGCALPGGQVTGRWEASNGRYHGFVYEVPAEADVPLGDGRDQVVNPDDPDGDAFEALAWWTPAQFADNPAIRPELLADLDLLLDALGADETVKVAALYKAAERHGNPAALRRWFDQGAGGRIPWGHAGDFEACVRVASEHMSEEQARGFCNLRHRSATGMWTAQHAEEERGK